MFILCVISCSVMFLFFLYCFFFVFFFFFFFFLFFFFFFFFQAEDGIRDVAVTGVQTCALPILLAVSFVLLLFAFRSLVVPLKAIVLNLLSVSAAWGLLVLVFQHGVGAEIGRASCRERV